MNIDILFCHSPKFNNFYQPIGGYSFILYHPIGLLGLADYIKKHGFSTIVIDLGIEKRIYGEIDIEKIINEYSPKVIGFDLHWHFQSYDVIRLAKLFKEKAPHIRILLGGFTATYFDEEILKTFNEVDFIIRGDAEEPLAVLLSELCGAQKFEDVPNLSWKKNGIFIRNRQSYTIDESLFNKLHFTDFTLIKDFEAYKDSLSSWVRLDGISLSFQKKWLGNHTTYPVVTGRGCQYECSFCGGSKAAQEEINRRKDLITRSVSAVVQSIEDIKEAGFSNIMFNWDALPDDKSEEYYRELFAVVRENKIKIRAEVERWQLPSEKFADDFKKTFEKGSYITLTISSYSEELRKRNQMYFFSNDELEETLNMLSRKDIPVTLFFTFGLPYEKKSHMIENASYQKKLRQKYKNINTRSSCIEIEPCSDISRRSREYHLVAHRKTFMDYHLYHSKPENNHYFGMGYSREACPTKAELKGFFCRNCCFRFRMGALSPVICSIFGAAWKMGLFAMVDRTIFSRFLHGHK
jgi:radical SAM superfamily enzyme YgiQ (UPF0313 family)